MEKAINTQRSGASDRLTAPSGAAYLLGRIGDQLVPALFLLALIIGLSLLSPNFLSISNFLDIARVVSITGIMAVGMTLVILTRGIDLSVGATFAVAASVTASFVPGNFSDAPTSIGINLPTPLAIAAGLLVGAGIGFVNGFIIAKSRVEPFIVTLATMTFVRGLTYLYTGGFPTIFRPMPPAFEWVGQGFVLGLPTPTIFFALVIAAGVRITRRTTFGRSIYAIGGNEAAARLSGIDVRRVEDPGLHDHGRPRRAERHHPVVARRRRGANGGIGLRARRDRRRRDRRN